MDALIIGLLTGCTSLLGMVLYLLLVRPEALMALIDDQPLAEDAFFEVSPATLTMLRVGAAAGLLIGALLTGAVAAFFAGTS